METVFQNFLPDPLVSDSDSDLNSQRSVVLIRHLSSWNHDVIVGSDDEV